MASFRISILGVGLLGGSIGLAASRRITDCQVIGYGHRRETRQRAIEVGAIHHAADNVADAVREADLVILATPVGLFDALLREMSPHLKAGAIVTDVGSTKRSIVRSAEALLPGTARFVGSHPMAGSEKRGVEWASAELFQNAVCILTPTERTDGHAVETVRQFWNRLGMRLIDMSPDEHDRALAQVSHLPHALAAALVMIQPEAALTVAGKGFLDATRIAAGDAVLWRDILLDNADNVRSAIELVSHQLQRLSQLIEEKDAEGLKSWLDQAARKRDELGERRNQQEPRQFG